MSKDSVPEPFASALELQSFLEKRNWRFCFIGGLAVARWGRVRATQDADVSLFTGFSGEDEVIDSLLSFFKARHDDSREFARQHRVVLLVSSSGVGLDIALAGLPFEDRAVERSSQFAFFSGVSLRTCSAEDLIVYKAFAGRGTDWDDVESIVIRQGKSLNQSLILDELRYLADLKSEPEIVKRVEELFSQAAHQ